MVRQNERLGQDLATTHQKGPLPTLYSNIYERLRTYMTAVRSRNPEVRRGSSKAYPFFTPARFGEMLSVMKDQGGPAAFLHADVHLPSLRKGRDDFLLNDLYAQLRFARVPR